MTLSFAPDAIETWPLSRLQPYAKNAKAHGADQVAKIAASMADPEATCAAESIMKIKYLTGLQGGYPTYARIHPEAGGLRLLDSTLADAVPLSTATGVTFVFAREWGPVRDGSEASGRAMFLIERIRRFCEGRRPPLRWAPWPRAASLSLAPAGHALSQIA